jgi:hydroxypyruvate isomerase
MVNRRTFLATSLTASAAASLRWVSTARAQDAAAKPSGGRHRFKLKYAPQLDQFKEHAGPDYVDQLKFMADEGFQAFMDNGLAGRPVELQERIGQEAARLGLTVGAFCASLEFNTQSLVSDKPEVREKLLADVKKAVETSKRVNGKWAIVVPGCFEPRTSLDYQTANLVGHMRAAADVAAASGLVLIIEPLNWRDHPNLFVRTISQCFQICSAVNSPSCKILNDLYHQQITEGNLIPNIDTAWSEIAHYHVGDNPGRKEPGTGEVNFKNIFRHLHEKGFQGVLGMEHGQSKKGKEGERAVIDAYVACDDF